MVKLICLKLLIALPWTIYLGWSDCKKRELPNRFTLGIIPVILAIDLAVSPKYALFSLLTGLLASLFLLLPYFLRASGAGDVKMLLAAGIIAGPRSTLSLILLVSLSGLVLAFGMLIRKQVDASRLKHYCRLLFDFRYDRAAGKAALPPADSEKCRIPFGIAIGSGLILFLFLELLSL